MNIIRIIITEGCKACEITKKLVLDAVDESLKYIRVQIIDCCDEDYKDFIKENNVTDFPATFFIKDDKIRDSYFGTRTKDYILSRIKRWF